MEVEKLLRCFLGLSVFLLYGIFHYQVLIFLVRMDFEVTYHPRKFENYQRYSEEELIENDLQLLVKKPRTTR